MSKLAYHVDVYDSKGEKHTFGPDSDDVPAWAVKAITNPSAWEGGEAPATSDTQPFSKWSKKELEGEIERRNADRGDDDLIEVEEPGNKAELVAALEGDDAAQA
jgi:hypothetical protein